MPCYQLLIDLILTRLFPRCFLTPCIIGTCRIHFSHYIFHNSSSLSHLLVLYRSIFLPRYIILTIYRLTTIWKCKNENSGIDMSPISVQSSFRFPTMPPPWVLTSQTWLRAGIPVRTLCRQTYTHTARTPPRKYSTTLPQANSGTNSRVLADPERPDLFYHLLEPPSSAASATNYVFGLSFFNALKSADVRSPQIIGYLPASEGGHAVEAGLNDFKENRKSACRSRATHTADDLVLQLGSGGFYIKLYVKGWSRGLMRFRQTGRASSRKGGCTSTVRLFVTITLTYPSLIVGFIRL